MIRFVVTKLVTTLDFVVIPINDDINVAISEDIITNKD